MDDRWKYVFQYVDTDGEVAKHKITYEVNPDLDIYELGHHIKRFLLASGFTSSTVDKIIKYE